MPPLAGESYGEVDSSHNSASATLSLQERGILMQNLEVKDSLDTQDRSESEAITKLNTYRIWRGDSILELYVRF
jgi:hypothetical protein